MKKKMMIVLASLVVVGAAVAAIFTMQIAANDKRGDLEPDTGANALRAGFRIGGSIFKQGKGCGS